VGEQGSSGLVRVGGVPVRGQAVPLDFDAVPGRGERIAMAAWTWGWPGTGSLVMTLAASASLRPV
jgi:hypothetical protein